MEIQERKSGRIYSLSSYISVPEWLSERSRRNLAKRDSNFRRRVTLLQDLEMPVASARIRQSPDGKFLIVGGTYPPRIRCYELAEMGMKFERYLDSEVVDVLILGEDYGKLAILGADRTVMFHAPYGNHEKIRLPTFGRAMAYEKSTCDLLIVSSGKRSGSGNRETMGEVYRFNLDEGRFSRPYSFPSGSKHRAAKVDAQVLQLGGGCITVSPTHSLTAVGAEDGTVRFWDNRVPPRASPDDVHVAPFLTLDVASATSGHGFFDENTNSGFTGEVTSICFDSAGMRMCAGTRGGIVALFDMRSSRPLFIKEHQYGLPIHTVQFHSRSRTVLSSDPKLVKIWNAGGSALSQTGGVFGGGDVAEGTGGPLGSIVANVEGTAEFSHFITSGDALDPSGQSNGLLLCAGEQSKVQSFYCPVLGTAPRWCSFLDSITEELEEKGVLYDECSPGNDSGVVQTETVYEDYKFLTRAEIEKLSMQNLVGTPLLRGYMHGFFVHVGLYNKIRSVVKPFEYDEYRKNKIKEKIDEKRASRITPKGAPEKTSMARARVNPALAERLRAKAGDKTKAGRVARALVEDDRFGLLFSNPDFEIDEKANDFILRNPSGVALRKRNNRNVDNGRDEEEGYEKESNRDTKFNQVASEKMGESWGGGNDDKPGGEEDFHESKNDYDRPESGKFRREEEKKKDSKNKDTNKTRSRNIMYETAEYVGGAADALGVGIGDASVETEAAKRKRELFLSMRERLQLQSEDSELVGETKRLRVIGQGSVREATFIPKSTREKMKEEEERSRQEATLKNGKMTRSRRGVKELGFKTPFKRCW